MFVSLKSPMVQYEENSIQSPESVIPSNTKRSPGVNYSKSTFRSLNATQTVPLLQNNGTSVVFSNTENWFIICIVLAVILIVMTTIFFALLCRCLIRKKKRENRLANITPKSPDHRMAGVRANQPIEFVVPTTVAVSANSEDSVSETDYSYSGIKYFRDRRRRKYSDQIHPDELQCGLYVGVMAASKKGLILNNLGRVGFSLRYNMLRSQLTVKIIGADDLPCHSMRTTANPCAKIVMLPDKTTKYVTRVQRDTTCPRFDESFVFCVRRDELLSKRLKISVWDYDRFSRKCLIGQIVYRLKDSGLTNAHSVDVTSEEIWVPLKHETLTSTGSGFGEILISLSYNPDTATLTLGVVKVRNLVVRQNKDTTIYAKVRLYVRRKLVRTKKTSSIRKAPEVEFGNPFSIHVPPNALQEVDLLVVLCEKGSLGSKRVIGRTQAGANSLCEQGLQHWQDMLASPKSTCAQWHSLCD